MRNINTRWNSAVDPNGQVEEALIDDSLGVDAAPLSQHSLLLLDKFEEFLLLNCACTVQGLLKSSFTKMLESDWPTLKFH